VNSGAIIHVLTALQKVFWSGGKRDEYSVLTEVNKLLFIKIVDELEDSRFFLKLMDGLFQEYSIESLEKLNNFFREKNSKYNIFIDEARLNLSEHETMEAVKLLVNFEFLKVGDFSTIYFNVLLKNIKTENLANLKFIETINRLFSSINISSLFLTHSQFGRVAIHIQNDKNYISTVENNRIRYETHRILLLCAQEHQEISYIDYLSLEKDSKKYENIFSIPPFSLKTKEYFHFNILDERINKDVATLYIEQSYKLLVDNGLLFIVIPDNFLSSYTLRNVRDHILALFELVAVLPLGNSAFTNTNIQTSLIILRKTNHTDISAHVLFKEFEESNIAQIAAHLNSQEVSENSKPIDQLGLRWDYHFHQASYNDLLHAIGENEWRRLGDLVELKRGSDLKSEEFGDRKLIIASSIIDGEIPRDKVQNVSIEAYEKQPRGIVQQGDLVITVAGKIGACALISEELDGANTNSAIVILRPRSSFNMTVEYLHNYLNSGLGQKLIHRIKQHGTINIITQVDLEELPVILDETAYKNIEKKFNLRDELREANNLVRHVAQFIEIPQIEVEKAFTLDEDISIVTEFLGIKGKVFGLDVIRAFASLDQLRYFETTHQNFQREIDTPHLNELVTFLKDKLYRFFPEIVIAIKNYAELIDMKLISEIETSLENIIRLTFNERDEDNTSVFDSFEILDGRHRIESIKKLLSEDNAQSKNTVSIVFILLASSDTESLADRAIFYNLNAKAKHLLPNDYLNILDNDDEDSLNQLGIVDIKVFKLFSKEHESIFGSHGKRNLLLEQCIDLTNSFVVFNKDIEEQYEELFKKTLELFSHVHQHRLYELDIRLKTKIYKLVMHIINEMVPSAASEMHIYVDKEITGFLEWLELTNLIDTIDQTNDLRDLYRTCKETYIPKSRRIFISMPYHKETEWTYYLIKDVINDIEKQLGIGIQVIRTDKEHDGVHGGIREAVYKQIEESDLMIADLTGNNPNVFNEIGYKMGLDKAKGLQEPQIIFIVNTKSYYIEQLEERKQSGEEPATEIVVDGKVLNNKSEQVAFNLSSIKQITFYESSFLKTELTNELNSYYGYYKISRVKP